jgi:hypothetical protein
MADDLETAPSMAADPCARVTTEQVPAAAALPLPPPPPPPPPQPPLDHEPELSQLREDRARLAREAACERARAAKTLARAEILEGRARALQIELRKARQQQKQQQQQDPALADWRLLVAALKAQVSELRSELAAARRSGGEGATNHQHLHLQHLLGHSAHRCAARGLRGRGACGARGRAQRKGRPRACARPPRSRAAACWSASWL